jgi:hypothetical protein
VLFAGHWCRGQILKRLGRWRAIVRLAGGTELSIVLRPQEIRRLPA